MTIVYNRNGDGTGTLVLTISAEETRFEEILYNYGKAVYHPEVGQPTFDELTTQQQLNIIEQHIKFMAITKDKAVQEREALDSVSVTTPEW